MGNGLTRLTKILGLVLALCQFQGAAEAAAQDLLSILKEEMLIINGLDQRGCVSYLKDHTDRARDYIPIDFLPQNSYVAKQFLPQSYLVLQEFWQIRLKLQDKLKEFYYESEGQVDLECVKYIRRAQRYLRVAEDILSEWIYRHENKKANIQTFKGGFPQLLVKDGKYTPGRSEAYRSDYLDNKGQLIYKPGDVILVRGSNFVSSSIARIGEEEGQFVHIGVIHQDAQGELWLVESLIETGLIVQPLKKWLEEKRETRAALYRFPGDPEISKKAGAIAYKLAKREPRLGYDFAMDNDDDSKVFCAEIANIAYKNAHKNVIGKHVNFSLPQFPSSLRHLNGHSFLKKMGITSKETFAPSDMEVEPRFDLIAEWRNIDAVRDTQMQDASLTMIYTWFRELNYSLTGSVPVLFMERAARILGMLQLTDRVTSDMSREFVTTALQLWKITKNLDDHLISHTRKQVYHGGLKINQGLTMSYNQILAKIEAYRKADCSLVVGYDPTALKPAMRGPEMHTILGVAKGFLFPGNPLAKTNRCRDVGEINVCTMKKLKYEDAYPRHEFSGCSDSL